MLSFCSWKIKTAELMNPCIVRAQKPWTRSEQSTANLEFLRNIRVIPVLVGMACLALNKHLPSLLFLFFSFCFSCVSFLFLKRKSFHHWFQEKLSDTAAVARSAYTVTWRELLDYNKSRWNQWLLMKSVFHCCSGAAHVAGAERLLLTHGAEGEVGSCCSRVNYRHRCCSRTGMEEWQLYLRERRLLVCLGKQGAGHVFFLFL